MMERIPEPELMDSEAQALAYAQADFSEPHEHFISLFRACFPAFTPTSQVLDLGCGPADVTIRFAKAYPACKIHGLDAGPNMLRLGRKAVVREKLEARVKLLEGHLPEATLPLEAYDAIISNSLLHHLSHSAVLWKFIRRYAKPGAPVFIMDLMRPENQVELDRLVKTHASNEPEVLRQDFFNSLRASYRTEEVRNQLTAANLNRFEVCIVSDRHLIVHGFI